LRFVTYCVLAFVVPLLSHTALAITKNSLRQSTTAQIAEMVDRRELSTEFFNNILAGNNIENKIAAIKGLGRIGGASIIPLIKRFTHDKNKDVRRASIFAIGLSGAKEANTILWQQLEIESDETVRKEIYLALGNLGQDGLISKVIDRLASEKSLVIQSSMFQSLAMALTYHSELKEDFSRLNYRLLLDIVKQDNQVSTNVLYFLARIPKIRKYIKTPQLPKYTDIIQTTTNKRLLAKLIGKIAKKSHLADRKLLSWLIEQSEQADVGLATEAIRSMGNFVYIPQSRIQLGKLSVANNRLIAQTALATLASSGLDARRLIKLLKNHLKSEYPVMVVTAMAGLIERQKREDMSWAFKILSNKNSFVKINFASLIYQKDKQGFANVIKLLSSDPDKSVSSYAKSLLAKDSTGKSAKTAVKAYTEAAEAAKKQVVLHTSKGDIKIQLSKETPYTALNFVTLVNQGFYNDSYFSRVIGNFVAQGGDISGDGNGGSNQTIREEISYLSHEIGTVGMATSGKDTGDSQFFINTGNNIHLDRNYTVFGKVISGMEVVFALSNGEQIISAEVIKP